MNPSYPVLRPLIVTFLLLTFLFVTVKLFFGGWGIGPEVVLGANSLFFLVSILVFQIQRRAMANKNPAVFIRSVMAGMMIKMLVAVLAVIGYVLISGKGFNKPAVYISMALYIVYLSVEVAAIMKLNKRKNA